MLSIRQKLALSFSAMILSALIVALVQVPNIQAWEKANGYPFGQMCNSVFTAYVDTCPATAR